MAYNYDPELLWRHESTVKELIDAWKENKVLDYTAQSPRESNNLKHVVRNLLANIDLNVDGCKGIREQMHTKVSIDSLGLWHIRVGRVVAGRGAKLNAATSYPAYSGPVEVWRVPDIVENDRDLLRVIETFHKHKETISAEAKTKINISEMMRAGASALGIKLQYIEKEGLYGSAKIVATRMTAQEKLEANKPPEPEAQAPSPDMGTPVSHEDFLKALDQYVDKAKRGGL